MNMVEWWVVVVKPNEWFKCVLVESYQGVEMV